MDIDSTEFVFHWDGGKIPWEDLHVVKFVIDEALSTPYRASLLLQARGSEAEIDPASLLGKLATLRIATLDKPAIRCFHGLIAEAAELGPGAHGMLYEVVLLPPIWRAMHRQRSRIFLQKTTRAILEAVLLGDPRMKAGEVEAEAPAALRDEFTVPAEKVVFRIADPSRLDDVTVRPYCVQYNESDFGFVSRLLEEEGISYHFEHSSGAVVLVLSDDDSGKTRLDPFESLSPQTEGRHIDHLRLGGRLRPTRVQLVEYNWQKPQLDMKVEAKGDGEDATVVDYPGGYLDKPEQGALLAKAMLERFTTEARFASARGSCRLLGAGTVFALAHTTPRYEGEYLVTRAELRGSSRGESGQVDLDLPGGVSFHAKVELARRGTSEKVEESRFRPPRSTGKPRIIGTQTAVITDEPATRGAEIHVGGPEGNENGCVRLRFHWDLEVERWSKEPSSCWVRVAQLLAGAGGGALFHPRVGTEVVVEYLDGDPDRPLVVGRVYNGRQLAPANGKGAATVSTIKSMSSPGGKVFNEIAFDDAAGAEKINLTAGKDWISLVHHDRSETIENDSTSTVLVNRTEDTHGNRSTHVGGNNDEKVDKDESLHVTGNRTLLVQGNQDIRVEKNEARKVIGTQDLGVDGARSAKVLGGESITIEKGQSIDVKGDKSERIKENSTLDVAAKLTVTVGTVHRRESKTDETEANHVGIKSKTTHVEADETVTVDATDITATAKGAAVLEGATVTVNAQGEVVISGASIKIVGDSIEIQGGTVKIAGGATDITGNPVKVN